MIDVHVGPRLPAGLSAPATQFAGELNTTTEQLLAARFFPSYRGTAESSCR